MKHRNMDKVKRNRSVTSSHNSKETTSNQNIISAFNLTFSPYLLCLMCVCVCVCWATALIPGLSAGLRL